MEANVAPANPTVAIGVDVGGSGIKVGVVDVDKGELVSLRLRVATPVPSTPQFVVKAIGRTVARAIKQAGGLPAAVPVGVGVPSVVINGVTKSAANIDPGWIDFDAGQVLQSGIGPAADSLAHKIAAVASGEETAAERNGEREIAIWKRGVTL